MKRSEAKMMWLCSEQSHPRQLKYRSYKEALDRWGDEVAAVLVEPIVGNFGIKMTMALTVFEFTL